MVGAEGIASMRLDRAARAVFLTEFVSAFVPRHALFLQAQADAEL